MTDVYLSYAHEDSERAQTISRYLIGRGLNVWADDRLVAGSAWKEQVSRTLDEALVVLVLWSRHSVRSVWVLEEASRARDRQKLLPVFIDRVSPPIGYASIQTLDLIDLEQASADNVGLERLNQEIRRRLVERRLSAAAEAEFPRIVRKRTRPQPSSEDLDIPPFLRRTPADASPRPTAASPSPPPRHHPASSDEPESAAPDLAPPPVGDAPAAEPPARPDPMPAVPLPPDVFVAYSRKDGDTCQAIVAALRSEGLEVFYDQFIQGGEEWREIIARNIKGCSVFVVLFSASSAASPQVRKEVNLATANSKSVIPVMLEDIPLGGGLEYELSGINFVSYHQNPAQRLTEIVEKSKTLAAIAVFDRRRETLQALASQPAGAAARNGPAVMATQAAPAPARWGQGAVALLGALILSLATALIVARAQETERPERIAVLAAALYFIALPYVIAVLLLFRRLVRG